MNSDETVTAILERLDEDDIEALGELVEESPELLRQTLEEYGYLDDENDEFLVNNEADILSEPQRELLEFLDGHLEPPMTVEEIREFVGAEESEYRKRYTSAQYRSWLSTQLKALADAGELGRFREGRTVLYAESPELAVRHWARTNEQFPQDLTLSDAPTIKDNTNMPGDVVKDAIRSITND